MWPTIIAVRALPSPAAAPGRGGGGGLGTSTTAQLTAVAAGRAAHTAVAMAIRGRAGPSDELRWPPFGYAVSMQIKLERWQMSNRVCLVVTLTEPMFQMVEVKWPLLGVLQK
jgi:hypothetical protein